MNDALRMKDIAGFSTNDALFTTIQTIGTLFPDVSTSELQLLAEEYYVHSSEKLLSPLCRKWVNEAVDLTAFINKVASALVTRYGRNWKTIYMAYVKTEYKPLENYSMEEIVTPRVETTIDVNVGTKVIAEQESKVYGFNSDTPVGDNDNKVTTTGDKDENETTTHTTFDGFDTKTRSGNIGVTTSQQMLSAEIALRTYDYWGAVFNDIDRLLCVIYASV